MSQFDAMLDDLQAGMDEETEMIKRMEMEARIREILNSITSGEYGKEEAQILDNILQDNNVMEMIATVRSGEYFTGEDEIVDEIEANPHMMRVFGHLDERDYVMPPLEEDLLPILDPVEPKSETAPDEMDLLNDRQVHMMADKENIGEYPILPHLKFDDKDIEDLNEAQENEVLM